MENSISACNNDNHNTDIKLLANLFIRAALQADERLSEETALKAAQIAVNSGLVKVDLPFKTLNMS